MRNLLKNDLFRIRKDKPLFIAVIALFGIVLLCAFIFLGIDALLKSALEDVRENGTAIEIIEAEADYLQMKQFFSGFYVFRLVMDMNGYGALVLPIFLAIFIGRDFNNNTIRNKVAAGYKRSEIYLSFFITSLIAGIIILLIDSLISFGFGSLIFQETGVEVGYFFQTFAVSILLYIVLLSITTFIALWRGGSGLVIAFTLGASFVLSFILLIPFDSINLNNGFLQFLVDAAHFLVKCTLYKQSTELFSNGGLTAEMAAITFVSSAVVIAGFTALGLYKFSKKDLK